MISHNTIQTIHLQLSCYHLISEAHSMASSQMQCLLEGQHPSAQRAWNFQTPGFYSQFTEGFRPVVSRKRRLLMPMVTGEDSSSAWGYSHTALTELLSCLDKRICPAREDLDTGQWSCFRKQQHTETPEYPAAARSWRDFAQQRRYPTAAERKRRSTQTTR